MDIVLVNPEIPQNTGSIARTCAATKTPLHLIRPMKFEIDEKRVKRAGLDYWPYVSLTIHESWQDYLRENQRGTIWTLSKYGSIHYYNASFTEDDAIVFGSESSGLSQQFMDQIPETHRLTIPMAEPAVRSLNLSNAVSIVLYEARRQLSLDQAIPVRSRTE